MEWLMNPWVIIVIVLSVVIGNLAALRATANMKFTPKKKQDSPLDENTQVNPDDNAEKSNQDGMISENKDEKKDAH